MAFYYACYMNMEKKIKQLPIFKRRGEVRLQDRQLPGKADLSANWPK
jgi:hypothetical protein